MFQYSPETLFQSFGTSEILLLVFPILIGTGLIYRYVKRRKSGLETATKKCPHCAKMVDGGSKICPLCQRMIV
jgi:hypothetical protein